MSVKEVILFKSFVFPHIFDSKTNSWKFEHIVYVRIFLFSTSNCICCTAMISASGTPFTCHIFWRNVFRLNWNRPLKYNVITHKSRSRFVKSILFSIIHISWVRSKLNIHLWFDDRSIVWRLVFLNFQFQFEFRILRSCLIMSESTTLQIRLLVT